MGSEIPPKERLDSWKEIAAYLDRNVSSVQRWEKEEDLPVHRHVHHKQASVYAYRSEIDTWIANRSTSLGNGSSGRLSNFLAKKKIVARVTSGAALLLLVGLTIWMATDSSPNAGGLNFQQRDWVLITDFENRTGETVFDGVLEQALQREVANSQFVNVVPRERIDDTLLLMRKPSEVRIDREVGREISLRDGGIKALLIGRVEKVGSAYLLSVELLDPSTDQSLAATSEEALRQDQVLVAIRSLSNWTRQTLGEALLLVEQSNKSLEKVTTPSLRALQLFTRADALIREHRSDVAEELLKQALEIDPEFASGQMHLAHALRNQRRPPEAYLPAAENAFRLSDKTSELEQYFIRGSYYSMKGEIERAIQSYEALLSLYPDHFWATNNLAVLYWRGGRQPNYALRLVRLRPNSVSANYLAGHHLALLESDLVQAKPYVERALNLLNPEINQDVPDYGASWLLLFPAYEALLRSDPENALLQARDSTQKLEYPGEFGRVPSFGQFYLKLGKLQQARKWMEENIFDATRRHYLLAVVAYIEEDDQRLAHHMSQFLSTLHFANRSFPPTLALSRNSIAILLALTGFSSEAEELASYSVNSDFEILDGGITKRSMIEAVQGVLALSQGKHTEGMKMLEQALPLIRHPQTADIYFMGSEILAEALRHQGDQERALQVLKNASEKRSFLLHEFALPGPLWLRIRARLAQLYREMDRDSDARTIEEDLRKRLAVADADHPILRELK